MAMAPMCFYVALNMLEAQNWARAVQATGVTVDASTHPGVYLAGKEKPGDALRSTRAVEGSTMGEIAVLKVEL